ncbi:MAG: Holliday junction resolvase RuvX [Acidaminococcaceae bacterium]|uniref:Holliday junction resolvase RuvX n=1 Tax=Succiniclasticum sp. TaxID=2775030 RepID=UPI000E94A5BE|nr:Holliday junction resolvase RuvX [Succiniclasticum sp.]MBO5590208.1 Holliday junction resolvase RuvX [Acidaminococcaceae bacterium]MBR1495129.1 Holliday junction resolvase RuvX [Acidaminococcaceae bacterium]MBR1662045.1 Holliday junction resolvase RuvX [Acidaminococcaceae bacterium]MDY6290184.1 Holliday junction resolvase RuvX [Succiniclasticum sp.]HAT98519.1 Holliday junction resolvase RuvX [Acidaminococcaceae bacterium]
MRSMSLDLGTRTIGVAVSDLTGLIANGVETIRRTSPERDFTRIGELVAAWEVEEIVLGYPKNMNGTIGERARVSEMFAEELKGRFPQVAVVLWDERLSTVAAERVLIDADLQRKKRRKVIDMMAAVVILQNYLDSKKLRGS